jgi:hypothetical protein
MYFGKNQVYVITLISILCLLLYCKRTEYHVESPEEQIKKELGGTAQDMLTEGAKQATMATCRRMGMTEAQTQDEGLKIDKMVKSIKEYQPKIVWLPDSDLKFFSPNGKANNTGLIRYQDAKDTTAKIAIGFLVEAGRDPDKVFIGFRPLENDTGVYYYVDRLPGDKVLVTGDKAQQTAYFTQWENYMIGPDKDSIGFYFMVNVLNYDYTRYIKMMVDILKFSLKN